MATSYDAFMPWVLINVPGVAEVAATQAVKDATIEFCELSLVHQADHDPVTVVANLVDYDLEAPVTGTRVFKVMRAWFKGKMLSPAAPDQVNDPSVYNQSIPGYEEKTGDPAAYLQKDSSTFSLMPIPTTTVANAVTMRVALVPLRSATTIADFLYENWGEFIAHGASARLLSMINRPWSNPNAAAYHRTRFQVGVNQARLQANKGYTRANLQMQFRRI